MGVSNYDKCPRYWRGCFSCRWYLGTEYIMFCRAYNMKKHDSEVVEVEVEKTDRNRSWLGKNGRRTNKKTSV